MSENKENSGELWKTLKKLGLPSKNGKQAKICLEGTTGVSHNTKTNCEIFKNFFENLAGNLLELLPLPPNRFDRTSVHQFYRNLNLVENGFAFSDVSDDSVLGLLSGIDPKKAVGVDRVAGRFIRDGATELHKPLSKLINASLDKGIFPDACKIAKLKPLYKKKGQH